MITIMRTPKEGPESLGNPHIQYRNICIGQEVPRAVELGAPT